MYVPLYFLFSSSRSLYTTVGERGINLSGGQKARVSLARALLAARTNSAEAVLLDDPFSAVDGCTANDIFERGVQDLLSDKLRIVALNSHLHLLERFDRIVVLHDGRVVADGTFSALRSTHADLIGKLVRPVEDGTKDRTLRLNPKPSTSAVSGAEPHSHAKEYEADGVAASRATQVTVGQIGADEADSGASAAQAQSAKRDVTGAPSKLVVSERQDVGAAPMKLYWKYFSSAFFLPLLRYDSQVKLSTVHTACVSFTQN
jgi:ABC-type multidrug transport system ATPase subunit